MIKVCHLSSYRDLRESDLLFVGISSALQSNMVECLTKIAGLYSARPQLGRALDANVLFERDRSPWTLVEEQVQATLISEE